MALAVTLTAFTATLGGSLSHYIDLDGANVTTRCGGGYQVSTVRASKESW